MHAVMEHDLTITSSLRHLWPTEPLHLGLPWPHCPRSTLHLGLPHGLSSQSRLNHVAGAYRASWCMCCVCGRVATRVGPAVVYVCVRVVCVGAWRRRAAAVSSAYVLHARALSHSSSLTHRCGCTCPYRQRWLTGALARGQRCLTGGRAGSWASLPCLARCRSSSCRCRTCRLARAACARRGRARVGLDGASLCPLRAEPPCVLPAAVLVAFPSFLARLVAPAVLVRLLAHAQARLRRCGSNCFACWPDRDGGPKLSDMRQHCGVLRQRLVDHVRIDDRS